MATPNTSIFRPEALQHRLDHQGQRATGITFPRWMAKPTTIALWSLLVVLAVGGGAACFFPVPVNASGLAMVMTARDDGSMPVVALMPADVVTHLHAGDSADVFPGSSSHDMKGTITSVEAAPLDAAAVEQRLGLPAGSMAALDGPVVLVWISLDPDVDPVIAGSAGRAELSAGSRRAGSFLPLVGRFL